MQSSMLQSTGRSEQQQGQSQDKGADTKAVQPKTVVALKGQLLHWRLLVANSGQLCLILSRLSSEHLVSRIATICACQSLAIRPCGFTSCGLQYDVIAIVLVIDPRRMLVIVPACAY